METTTASSQFTYEINPKEQFYFAVKIFFSIIMYYLIFVGITGLASIENKIAKMYVVVILFYTALILVVLGLRFILLIGHLRGNAIKVNSKQFPDIYKIAVKHTTLLGLSSVPDIYILQSGGILNAFAMSFLGRNYVTIYSDVLAAAYEQNESVVEFIIGHEMGHIKRKHLIKRLLLFPAGIIPFLGLAYSRACEYTCDSIGHALCPEGARPGMLLLAAGRGLFSKVNTAAFIAQIETEDGFTSWFAEKLSTHPNLTKRVRAFKDNAPVMPEPIVLKETSTDDISKYMPK